MNSLFKNRRGLRRVWAGLVTACALNVQAHAPVQGQAHPHTHTHPAAMAARDVLPFDEGTWAQLLEKGPRPAAYLFTTSYCSTCPAAFAVLHSAVKGRKAPPELHAVMMDVGGAQALRHAAHFKGMTRMYAFDGFEPAIRQSVDPHWPNVTPYVVLVDKRGHTQRVIGPPGPDTIRRWLDGR